MVVSSGEGGSRSRGDTGCSSDNSVQGSTFHASASSSVSLAGTTLRPNLSAFDLVRYVTSNRKCSNEAICDRSDPPKSTYISLFSQTHTGTLIPPSPSPRVRQNYDISLSDYSNMTQVVSIALSIEISMSCA